MSLGEIVRVVSPMANDGSERTSAIFKALDSIWTFMPEPAAEEYGVGAFGSPPMDDQVDQWSVADEPVSAETALAPVFEPQWHQEEAMEGMSFQETGGQAPIGSIRKGRGAFTIGQPEDAVAPELGQVASPLLSEDGTSTTPGQRRGRGEFRAADGSASMPSEDGTPTPRRKRRARKKGTPPTHQGQQGGDGDRPRGQREERTGTPPTHEGQHRGAGEKPRSQRRRDRGASMDGKLPPEEWNALTPEEQDARKKSRKKKKKNPRGGGSKGGRKKKKQGSTNQTGGVAK